MTIKLPSSRSHFRFLQGPWTIGFIFALTIAFYSGILWSYARHHFQGNITGFICFGDRNIPSRLLPKDAWIWRRTPGYDGQFYYFAARDPFLRLEFHKYDDVPAYRYQRIGYPALVRIASLGNPDLIPLMMLVINIVLIAFSTAIIARLLRQKSMSCWWAMLFPSLSGMLLATIRDLTEPTAVFFLIIAVVAYEKRKYAFFSLLMACSILSREMTLAMTAVFLYDSIMVRRSWRASLATLLSIAPYAIWCGYLVINTGIFPWQAGQQNFGAPFGALASYMAMIFVGHPDHPQVEGYYAAFFVSAQLLTLVYALKASWQKPDFLSLGLLGYSCMPFVMSAAVWVDPWSYGRVLLIPPTLLFLHFVRGRARTALIPLTFHMLATVAVIDFMGIFPRFIH
jgi:hypothetical protein